MFLHEPGEENESFTRQDLSSMNVISTQSPSQANMASTTSQPPQPQPPPQQAPQQIAAALQPADDFNRDDLTSEADLAADGSALPTTASWAAKNQFSRRPSRTTESASPVSSLNQPLHVAAPSSRTPIEEEQKLSSAAVPAIPQVPPFPRPQSQHLKTNGLALLASKELRFVFDTESVSSAELALMRLFPPLFDPDGGKRRQQSRLRVLERENHGGALIQNSATRFDHEPVEGGSQQLGGEPEDERQNREPQQYLLSQFKSGTTPDQLTDYPPSAVGSHGQTGHMRQTSRFSFANDTATASASVKAVGNQKLMKQQSSMMPPASQNIPHNPSQQTSTPFFGRGVQGPPPGLKAIGTPPVSGGGMFGQGHGFGTAGIGYGNNNMARTANDEMMRELLLRNRGSSAESGHASDNGRREYISVRIPSLICRANYRR